MCSEVQSSFINCHLGKSSSLNCYEDNITLLENKTFIDEFDKVVMHVCGSREESSSLNTHVYTLPCVHVGKRGSSLNSHVHARRFIAELPCACGILFFSSSLNCSGTTRSILWHSCLGEKKALISRIFVW